MPGYSVAAFIVRMFGDGLIHGSPGFVVPGVTHPVAHLDHGEVGADLPLAVEQLRELAHRQAGRIGICVM